MGQVLTFSLTASLNPTLLAATTLMLLLDRPSRLMLGYLLGAYLVSITLGCIIVFAIPDSSATKTTQNSISPAATIGLGVIALIAAAVLHSGRHRELAARRRARKAQKGEAKEPRWQRELSKGSPRTTFVIGILLTLPGASYLLALDAVHKLNSSAAVDVLLVVLVNVIMLWLLEVPLIAFKLWPDATPRAIASARAWVGRHAQRFAERGLAVVGLLLVVKGVILLL